MKARHLPNADFNIAQLDAWILIGICTTIALAAPPPTPPARQPSPPKAPRRHAVELVGDTFFPVEVGVGVGIAEQFAARGASVTVVLGPPKEKAQHPSINTVKVESAQQMYEAAVQHFEHTDIAVLSAAVADYRPAHIAEMEW